MGPTAHSTGGLWDRQPVQLTTSFLQAFTNKKRVHKADDQLANSVFYFPIKWTYKFQQCLSLGPSDNFSEDSWADIVCPIVSCSDGLSDSWAIGKCPFIYIYCIGNGSRRYLRVCNMSYFLFLYIFAVQWESRREHKVCVFKDWKYLGPDTCRGRDEGKFIHLSKPFLRRMLWW